MDGASCGFAPTCTIDLSINQAVNASFAISGSTLWAVRAGGLFQDAAEASALTPNGDVVVAGTYRGDMTIGTTIPMAPQSSTDLMRSCRPQ